MFDSTWPFTREHLTQMQRCIASLDCNLIQSFTLICQKYKKPTQRQGLACLTVKFVQTRSL